MASMYPFGGPRFREGPRKVHATEITEIISKSMTGQQHGKRAENKKG